MMPEDDYDPDQPSDADAELLGELLGERTDEYASQHRHLPEQCDFWPSCDQPHAGPGSLDSWPL